MKDINYVPVAVMVFSLIVTELIYAELHFAVGFILIRLFTNSFEVFIKMVGKTAFELIGLTWFILLFAGGIGSFGMCLVMFSY